MFWKKKVTDLWVAKMVNKELTADLPWTSSGGKEAFVCSGPPDEGGKVSKSHQKNLDYGKFNSNPRKPHT